MTNPSRIRSATPTIGLAIWCVIALTSLDQRNMVRGYEFTSHLSSAGEQIRQCHCGKVVSRKSGRCCPHCGRPLSQHRGSAPSPPTPPPAPTPDSESPSDIPEPSEPNPGPDNQPNDPPAPSLDDFSSFQPQSQVTGASRLYAPPMIGNTFGGGSSSVILTTSQNFSAVGTVVAGLAGSANADLSFDLLPADALPNFISVGLGRDELNHGDGIDTFDVAELVPGTILVPPAGANLDSATARRMAGTGSYVDGENWDITAIFATAIDVPNPSATVVGRLRIGENSSPIPRHRVFINYSYFDNVPLHPDGVNVRRVSPGFECMLTDTASFEMRTPFASTLSSTFNLDGVESNNTEFGDLYVVFKQLLLETENTLWSAGTGVTLPTADDLNIGRVGGTDLVHVKNRTVHFQPFIGYLLTLTDNLFVQGFVQLDIDMVGNKVKLNPNAIGTGLQNAGTIHDTTLFYNDISFGYWLRRRGEHRDKFITSLVPMFEIHNAHGLGSPDRVSLGSVTLGRADSSFDAVTFVLGSQFEILNNNEVTLGYAFPGSDDRLFDGEFRFFWNHYL